MTNIIKEAREALEWDIGRLAANVGVSPIEMAEIEAREIVSINWGETWSPITIAANTLRGRGVQFEWVASEDDDQGERNLMRVIGPYEGFPSLRFDESERTLLIAIGAKGRGGMRTEVGYRPEYKYMERNGLVEFAVVGYSAHWTGGEITHDTTHSKLLAVRLTKKGTAYLAWLLRSEVQVEGATPNNYLETPDGRDRHPHAKELTDGAHLTRGFKEALADIGAEPIVEVNKTWLTPEGKPVTLDAPVEMAKLTAAIVETGQEVGGSSAGTFQNEVAPAPGLVASDERVMSSGPVMVGATANGLPIYRYQEPCVSFDSNVVQGVGDFQHKGLVASVGEDGKTKLRYTDGSASGAASPSAPVEVHKVTGFSVGIVGSDGVVKEVGSYGMEKDEVKP